MCLEYIVNQMCDTGSLEHPVKTDLKIKIEKMHHVFFFLFGLQRNKMKLMKGFSINLYLI